MNTTTRIHKLFLTAQTVNPPRVPLHLPNESIADKHPINIQIFCRKLYITLWPSKDFVHYFRCSRSGQVHKFMAALSCLRSVETNLTPTCPSPKLFVCNLPDSGRHVTRVFQGLSLSRSVGRVGENPGNEVVVLDSLSVWLCHPMLSSIRIPSDLVVETCFIGILSSDSPKGFR